MIKGDLQSNRKNDFNALEITPSNKFALIFPQKAFVSKIEQF